MYILRTSQAAKLSSLCGRTIAERTEMACDLVFLLGRRTEQMAGLIRNMAESITEMICDGGNQGCALNGVVTIYATYRSTDLAMAGVTIDGIHEINVSTPEEAMRNMGLIASPGMAGAEQTIMEIPETKSL